MKFISARSVLLFAIVITVALFILDYVMYGSGISGDTAEYLALAGDVSNLKFPYSDTYLPGFPLLVGFAAKLFSLKIYQAAVLWMGLFFIINLIYIGKIATYLCKINSISKTGAYFLFFILISWWSFRIQKATHADAMYFCLLIILTYYIIKSLIENNSGNFIIVGLVLAMMTITKYNSYVLVPIVGLLILLGDYDLKVKLKYFALAVSPALLFIAGWKTINGGFIYSLKADNYENKGFSISDVLESFYTNISDSGRTLVELLINPVVGRFLNLGSGFVIGLIAILSLVFLLYKSRRNKVEFVFLAFALIYICSLILILSLNLVSEINIRTLNTFCFYLFLLLGLYTLKGKNKMFAAGLFVILLANNLLMAGKWLTVTSKGNSFNYEYKSDNEATFQDKFFLKSIEGKNVMSNDSGLIMFHLNYKKHIESFDSNFLFRKGKFCPVKTDEVKQISNDLKSFLNSDGIVLFSNPKSANDKILLNELSSNNYCFNRINNLIIISKLELNL